MDASPANARASGHAPGFGEVYDRACDAHEIPLRVNGVTRAALLERMAHALIAHGSNPLRHAIERWRDELMPVLSTAPTADECIARLREMDGTGTGGDASAGVGGTTGTPRATTMHV